MNEVKLNEETKICWDCGEELSIQRFERLKKGDKVYRIKSCMKCRVAKAKENKLKSVTNFTGVTIRERVEYKEISSLRKLDVTKCGVELIEPDEVFVKMPDYINSWISN